MGYEDGFEGYTDEPLIGGRDEEEPQEDAPAEVSEEELS